MKSAGSSKGKFLPSEVPRAEAHSKHYHCYSVAAKKMHVSRLSSTSQPGCRGEPIFQILPALRQHSYTISSKNRIRGLLLLQGEGMWVKASFQLVKFPWLRNKTISTPQVYPHPDYTTQAEIWRTDLPLAAVRNLPLQQGKISCLESPLDVTAQTKYKLLITGFLVTLPLHAVPGGTFSRLSVLWA